MGYKYNWTEIRTRFETGRYSLRDLAVMYGESKTFYTYLKQRKLKEEWEIKEETSEKLTKASAKKAFGDVVDEEAKLKQEYAKYTDWIKKSTINELFDLAMMKREKKPVINASDNTGAKELFNKLKCLKIASEILGNAKNLDYAVREIKEVAKDININGKMGIADVGNDPLFKGMSSKEIQELVNKL